MKLFKVFALITLSITVSSVVYADDLTAIVGGRIIDGNGGTPINDGVILIEGDRIKAVGKDGGITIPEGTKIIDADGMTIMPGLIDVHVHFDILGHADYNHWFATYEDRMRSDILPSAAKAMLNAGVTSVRDLGADVSNIFWIRDQINSGQMIGPRTFIAGPFLRKTVTAFVSETYKDTWPIESPEDAREKVRKLKSMGVDVIKTQDEALSEAELAAIYDEAHKQGLRVASHIYSADGIKTALKAGMGPYDTIEHIGDGEAPEYDSEILDLILQNQVAMAPTIIALDGLAQIIDNPELTDDPRWKRDLPADIYADVRRSYRNADLSAHPLYKRATTDRPGRMAKLRQLADAGAVFAVSSDSGTRGNPHHDALWKEMVLLQEATGKTNMEILIAATKTNAIILNQLENLGTLETGKFADIILIDGDPLAYLSDMRRVRHVIKGGKVIR
ncbi:amidohydrolase family protein [Kordiimonas sp. SCSIO 12610]|uniref:amidohydrolase family protein n=1 Tax=Kordiimonas sp. SCSIO 12610 TaxID=2829597 RepID=UPI00210A0307|nr:amidohydrolase family protein [Kordiimonas sp. SCSIO 12610]UTW55922.1 amidohydrolase family protein [Kordiimonas sp. SCSIO 12610]